MPTICRERQTGKVQRNKLREQLRHNPHLTAAVCPYPPVAAENLDFIAGMTDSYAIEFYSRLNAAIGLTN